MKALLYLRVRMLINGIKQLKEQPSRLISALIYLSFLAFIFVVPSGETESFGPVGQGTENTAFLIFSAIFFLVLLIMNTIIWQSGTKKGMSIFTFPDTQFLFTSPIKQATILLYGMIGQLKSSLISTVFMLYQIPNLRRVGLSTQQLVAVFAIWFLMLFSNNIINAFIYAVSFQSTKRKSIALTLIYALPIILLLFYGYLAVREASLIGGLLELISSDFLYFIPGAGWAKGIMDGFLFGFGWLELACLAFFIISPIILLHLIYKIDIDYYEDALTMVQVSPGTDAQTEAVKAAQLKSYQKMKIRQTGLNKGYGESSIFYKQWREHRRTRPYIIGFGMILVLLILGIPAVVSGGDELANNPIIFWSISAFAMFFLSFNSTTLKALNEYQFFTLPGKSRLKILYAGLLGVLLAVADLVPAYLFVIIYVGLNPLLLIVGLLLSGSLFVVFNSSQIIVFRIFGEIKSAFSTMVLLTLTIMTSIPGLVLIIVGGFNAGSNGVWWSYLLLAAGFIVNCLLGLLGIEVGRKYLEGGPIR